MRHKFRLILSNLAMAFLAIIIYVILHESGHALVAVWCGAEDIRITILGAYTSWTGGNFTWVTQSICNAAGTVFPVLVSWVFMIFYSKNRKSPAYHIMYYFLGVISTVSVLSWVLIPLYTLVSAFPNESDDVIKFLNSSGFSPIAVVLTALLVILVSVLMIWKKGIFARYCQIIKQGAEGNLVLSRRSMVGLLVAVLVAGLIVVLPELPDLLTKPVFSLTITDEIPEFSTQKTFEISQEKEYRFQIELDADGFITDICILDSSQEVVFQTLAAWMSFDSILDLKADTYTLLLTYLTDADSLEAHCISVDYGYDDSAIEELKAIYKQEPHLSKLQFTLT